MPDMGQRSGVEAVVYDACAGVKLRRGRSGGVGSEKV